VPDQKILFPEKGIPYICWYEEEKAQKLKKNNDGYSAANLIGFWSSSGFI